MLIDVRWLLLGAVTIFLVVLARRAPRWAGPIAIGVAAAGLLYVMLQL